MRTPKDTSMSSEANREVNFVVNRTMLACKLVN